MGFLFPWSNWLVCEAALHPVLSRVHAGAPGPELWEVRGAPSWPSCWPEGGQLWDRVSWERGGKNGQGESCLSGCPQARRPCKHPRRATQSGAGTARAPACRPGNHFCECPGSWGPLLRSWGPSLPVHLRPSSPATLCFVSLHTAPPDRASRAPAPAQPVSDARVGTTSAASLLTVSHQPQGRQHLLRGEHPPLPACGCPPHLPPCGRDRRAHRRGVLHVYAHTLRGHGAFLAASLCKGTSPIPRVCLHISGIGAERLL